jgi:chromosome segregation ATPase
MCNLCIAKQQAWETQELIAEKDKRIEELEADTAQLEVYLNEERDKIAELTLQHERLEKQLMEDVAELEEIETDLNSTLGYAERGVAIWKTRAEELEAELALHEWVDIKDRLPEKNQYVLVHGTLNDYVADGFFGQGLDMRGITHWKLISLPKQEAKP